MHRRFLKEVRGAFPQSAVEHAEPVMQLLQLRRAEVDAAWEELEKGWDANSERMVTLKVRPRTHEESVVNLNVGGSNVTVFRHLLAETEGFEDSILGALLEGVWGEGRIPLDADGRIVLDESPTSIKHIIARTTLRANGRAGSVAVGLPEGAARSAVAIDEAPCLIYTAYLMRLSGYVPTIPQYPRMSEGSTIFEPFEIAPLGAKIPEWNQYRWCANMTLIYRATRDGFGRKAFNARCNHNSPKTVSFLRVSSGEGNDDSSIVGGFDVDAWVHTAGNSRQLSPNAFVFMLKDGSSTRKDPSKPIKLSPNSNGINQPFVVSRDDGPYFGGGDLVTIFDEPSGNCTIQITHNQSNFQIGSSPPFLALNGKKVVDIEVYRCSTAAPPTTTAPSTTEPDADVLTDAEARDIRLFGESIASSFLEERVVLKHAVKEMEAAGARVSAAVVALETVYGPSVAAGEQDAVVELNVRGKRMTTLRSTLQACPRSALAAMFNEERWPATDKDKDEHGRRLIDCDPTCFSKILDVMRMRKRASWGRGVAGGKQEEEEEEEEGECSGVPSGAVLIKKCDVEVFGEAVNMYFPGCESFIMDVVQSV